MSRYHENTTWQSPDGTWNRGMYPQGPPCGGECDDDSHEWCSDFDHHSFEWVSTGHPTYEAAKDSWDGANPGHTDRIAYDPADPTSVERVEELEDMAAVLCETATERAAEDRTNGRRGVMWSDGRTYTTGSLAYYGYHGPAKQRSLRSLGRARNDAEKAALSYPLSGQPNPFADHVKAAQEKVQQRLATATDAEKREYLGLQKERRDGLDRLLDEHAARQERQRRANAASIGMYRGYDAKAAQRRAERQQIIRDAEDTVAKKIAGIDATRAKQEAEWFPPATTTQAAKTAGPQGRVAKGVPTGGQFTASQRAEPDVRL